MRRNCTQIVFPFRRPAAFLDKQPENAIMKPLNQTRRSGKSTPAVSRVQRIPGAGKGIAAAGEVHPGSGPLKPVGV